MLIIILKLRACNGEVNVKRAESMMQVNWKALILRSVSGYQDQTAFLSWVTFYPELTGVHCWTEHDRKLQTILSVKSLTYILCRVWMWAILKGSCWRTQLCKTAAFTYSYFSMVIDIKDSYQKVQQSIHCFKTEWQQSAEYWLCL